MHRRLSWLLASLTVALPGCGDPIIIGNAYNEGGLEQDGAVFASDAGQDAAPGDAGDAQVDASMRQALIQASQALAGAERWVSQPFLLQPAASALLMFLPEPNSENGSFVFYCPEGCALSDTFRDPTQPANRSVYMGRYALYHVNPGGMVLGALFSEDGRAVNLQFNWGNRSSASPPLNEIFLSLLPIGRLSFLADSSAGN